MQDRQIHENCLGLFAKYWQPGRVKTRLAFDLGAEEAALLYRAFVQTTLERLSAIDAARVLVCDPQERCAEMANIATSAWRCDVQGDGDLGRRMQRFFQRQFANGHARVVVLGTDSPQLPLEYVAQAFTVLKQHDVALGPTDDGGYYLVGAAQRTPPIFDDMPWSTEQLWTKTVAALAGHGVRFAELPKCYDVDVLDDLRRLQRELAENPPADPAIQGLRAAIDRRLTSN